MSETREPGAQGAAIAPSQFLVTRYPTAPDVLVITAPQNMPMSFQQLLAMNGLTPEVIAGLQPPGATGGTGGTGATGAMGAVEQKK